MSAISINTAARWYQAWWLWLVIAPPLAAVLGGIATMWLALRGADGVVATDYYKRGLEINTSIARSQRAAALGLQARIDTRALQADGSGQIRLRLISEQPLPADAVLTLQFVHPTRSESDRTLVLARSAVDASGRAAVYMGTLETPLAQGVAWRVSLSARDWRLQGDYTSHAELSLQADAGRP